MLEVYNETIRDLLQPRPTPLDVREDPVQGIQVPGLSEHEPSDADEVLSLLAQGNRCASFRPNARMLKTAFSRTAIPRSMLTDLISAGLWSMWSVLRAAIAPCLPPTSTPRRPVRMPSSRCVP